MDAEQYIKTQAVALAFFYGIQSTKHPLFIMQGHHAVLVKVHTRLHKIVI